MSTTPSQLAFDFSEPATVSPPHNGRDTSIDAAEQIRPDAGRLRKMVFDAIQAVGAEGLTDRECQLATGLQGSTQRPRRIELQRLGLITDSGQRRPTASGRQAVVWVAKERLKTKGGHSVPENLPEQKGDARDKAGKAATSQ